jgi:O-antigen biosynthesis protein WbqP
MTPIEPVLRRTILEELPQIWSLLCSKMSFVRTSHALYNQEELIKLRAK